jgi:hypothetical protein
VHSFAPRLDHVPSGHGTQFDTRLPSAEYVPAEHASRVKTRALPERGPAAMSSKGAPTRARLPSADSATDQPKINGPEASSVASSVQLPVALRTNTRALPSSLPAAVSS